MESILHRVGELVNIVMILEVSTFWVIPYGMLSLLCAIQDTWGGKGVGDDFHFIKHFTMSILLALKCFTVFFLMELLIG